MIAPELRLAPEGRDARLAYEPGQELSFGMVLIGCAQEFFPHFVIALLEMDRIGRGRRAVELARIEASNLWDTSTRMVYDGRDNVVTGRGSPNDL